MKSNPPALDSFKPKTGARVLKEYEKTFTRTIATTDGTILATFWGAEVNGQVIKQVTQAIQSAAKVSSSGRLLVAVSIIASRTPSPPRGLRAEMDVAWSKIKGLAEESYVLLPDHSTGLLSSARKTFGTVASFVLAGYFSGLKVSLSRVGRGDFLRHAPEKQLGVFVALMEMFSDPLAQERAQDWGDQMCHYLDLG